MAARGTQRTGFGSLLAKATPSTQTGLEGAEAPVVVLLPRQQLARQREERHKLAAQRLGLAEALGEENHLTSAIHAWMRKARYRLSWG